jgi:hypothetical protein
MINKEERKKLEDFVYSHTGFKTICKLIPSTKEVCIACAWIGNQLFKFFPEKEIEKMCFKFGRTNYLLNKNEIWQNATKLVNIALKEIENGRKNV